MTDKRKALLFNKFLKYAIESESESTNGDVKQFLLDMGMTEEEVESALNSEEDNGIKPYVETIGETKIAHCGVCNRMLPPLYKYEDGTEILNLSAFNYCPTCGNKIDRRNLR